MREHELQLAILSKEIILLTRQRVLTIIDVNDLDETIHQVPEGTLDNMLTFWEKLQRLSEKAGSISYLSRLMANIGGPVLGSEGSC